VDTLAAAGSLAVAGTPAEDNLAAAGKPCCCG